MTAAEKAARLNGLVEAAEYLRGKSYLDAAAELTVLINVELAAAVVRFEEEKPPAGHHAPASEESECEWGVWP